MTDNEKRAHDLAIMSTRCFFEMKLDDNNTYNENHPENPKGFDFDLFEEYLAAYESYLARFNEAAN
jgi:hypothetical protein